MIQSFELEILFIESQSPPSVYPGQKNVRHEYFSDLRFFACLLYTSDAADERSSVDLGGRRIIKKKKREDMGGSSVVK